MRLAFSIVLAVLAYQAGHRAAPPAVVVVAPPPVVMVAPPPVVVTETSLDTLDVKPFVACPCRFMNRICTLGLDPPECVERFRPR
jgi:hypothetical protein